MGTPIQDVFDKFMIQIDDDTKYYMEATLLDELLRLYLSKAISKFRDCQKELKIVDDYFTEVLDDDEQFILAQFMVLQWLSPKILCNDNLTIQFSDVDYNQKNPASLLTSLKDMKREIEKALQRDLVEYSYKNRKVGWN
ncbi:MAG: hypothetical protein ACI32Z_01025 [Clostridium sp.]